MILPSARCFFGGVAALPRWGGVPPFFLFLAATQDPLRRGGRVWLGFFFAVSLGFRCFFNALSKKHDKKRYHSFGALEGEGQRVPRPRRISVCRRLKIASAV